MINEMKEILQDGKTHISLAMVKKLYLAEDRSYLKILVTVMPDGRDIIASMTWENVGPEFGDFTFPIEGDLVLVAYVEGDVDQSFIIKRLSSRIDKIPEIAAEGHKVQISPTGKKFWNISDTKILIGRSQEEPKENLVLGQVFKLFAETLLETLQTHAQNNAVHTHIGNLGYKTAPPDNANDHLSRKSEYDTLKTDPISNEAILSDLSFTEK